MLQVFDCQKKKKKKNIIGIEVCTYTRKSLKIQTSSMLLIYLVGTYPLISVEKGTPVSSRLAFPFLFFLFSLFIFFLSINKLQSCECSVKPTCYTKTANKALPTYLPDLPT